MDRATLMKMQWKDFSAYPLQMSSIYIHCYGKDPESGESLHKFIAIETFNACSFCPLDITNKLNPIIKWRMQWCYANQAKVI